MSKKKYAYIFKTNEGDVMPLAIMASTKKEALELIRRDSYHAYQYFKREGSFDRLPLLTKDQQAEDKRAFLPKRLKTYRLTVPERWTARAWKGLRAGEKAGHIVILGNEYTDGSTTMSFLIHSDLSIEELEDWNVLDEINNRAIWTEAR